VRGWGVVVQDDGADDGAFRGAGGDVAGGGPGVVGAERAGGDQLQYGYEQRGGGESGASEAVYGEGGAGVECGFDE